MQGGAKQSTLVGLQKKSRIKACQERVETDQSLGLKVLEEIESFSLVDSEMKLNLCIQSKVLEGEL